MDLPPSPSFGRPSGLLVEEQHEDVRERRRGSELHREQQQQQVGCRIVCLPHGHHAPHMCSLDLLRATHAVRSFLIRHLVSVVIRSLARSLPVQQSRIAYAYDIYSALSVSAGKY